MQTYTAKTPLTKYRKDAVHRKTMCTAIASMPGEPKAAEHTQLATLAQGSIDAIDARMLDFTRASDLVTEGRALEDVSKLYGKKAYEQLRLDFMAEAQAIFRTFLPLPPSAFDKVGAKRAIAMVEAALGKIKLPDIPESIRTEHVPAVEVQLTRMREADITEDEAQVALAALRAAIVLFKANQQAEREKAYGLLVGLVGKADADAFFLATYSRPGKKAEDELEEDAGEDDDDDDDDGPPPSPAS